MHENCGIAGIVDLEGKRDVVALAVRLAEALQHRGELGAGIAWKLQQGERGRLLGVLKDNGLVRHVLSPSRIAEAGAASSSAIVHTRYATNVSLLPHLVQPYHYPHDEPEEEFAMGFNGNLPDTVCKEEDLRAQGIVPRFEGDTEILGQSIVASMRRNRRGSMTTVFRELGTLDGSYNPAILNGLGDVYAFRDRRGFHPLAWTEVGSLVAFASEDTALRQIWHDARIKDLKPGQLLRIRTGPGTVSQRDLWERDPKLCFFEVVYFGDHRSHIDGVSVANARHECGKILAEMDRGRPDTDVVVPVPESAKIAANGYADARSLRRVDVIRKNPSRGDAHVGRTFISAVDRAQKALLKYDIDESLLTGRRIILIDDSIVRGTTMKVLVAQLRAKGVKEVHLRLASPPIVSPCFYGIDFPTVRELLVRHHSDGTLIDGVLPDDVLTAMAAELQVDSIRYLPVDAIPRALGKDADELCMACVTQRYPTEAGERLYQLALREPA